MSYESAIVRVELEYANGSIQRLTGEMAAAWLEAINKAVTASQDQVMVDYRWEWNNLPIFQRKKQIAEWYRNYDGMD